MQITNRRATDTLKQLIHNWRQGTTAEESSGYRLSINNFKLQSTQTGTDTAVVDELVENKKKNTEWGINHEDFVR